MSEPRILFLTQPEWDAVASLCELVVDSTSLTFGEYADCNGTAVANTIRERMRSQEEESNPVKKRATRVARKKPRKGISKR